MPTADRKTEQRPFNDTPKNVNIVLIIKARQQRATDMLCVRAVLDANVAAQ
jgi:hypothetical protein